MRWISHRDLARLWERMLRRAQFELSMTEGFHPKPRIGFPSALALGVESRDEVVEIELSQDLSPQEVLARLEADQQPGLSIKRVSRLPEGFGKAALVRCDYTITMIDDADSSEVDSAIADLLSRSTVEIERKKKTVPIDLPSQILALERDDRNLRLTLAASDSAALRPADVLDLLGFTDWIENGSKIVREHVILRKDLVSDDPQTTAASNGDAVTTPLSLETTETERDA